MLAAEVPKVTDWMQAWGSLLGVGVSTLAVIITGLLLRHEIRARRDEQADSEAAQARLVVGSLKSFASHGAPRGTAGKVACQVDNYSGGPVFDLVVVAQHSGVPTEPGKINMVGGETVVWLDLPSPIPHEELEGAREAISFELSFTDCNGLRWKRLDREVPMRIIQNARKSWLDRVPQPIVAIGLGAVGVVLGVVALFIAA